MSEGLVEVAEDDSWVKGQSESLRLSLAEDTPNVRAVRAASEMLAQTRARQRQVRTERKLKVTIPPAWIRAPISNWPMKVSRASMAVRRATSMS